MRIGSIELAIPAGVAARLWAAVPEACDCGEWTGAACAPAFVPAGKRRGSPWCIQAQTWRRELVAEFLADLTARAGVPERCEKFAASKLRKPVIRNDLRNLGPNNRLDQRSYGVEVCRWRRSSESAL